MKDRNIKLTNQKKIYRIVTLCDSFIYGQFINTAENWISRKEKVHLYAEIPELKHSSWTLPDSYPSPDCHKMIAQNIYGYLVKGQILPCLNNK